ncbi:MAG: BACON domain-containing protein [Candidatus Hydrogenedentota bacterium]
MPKALYLIPALMLCGALAATAQPNADLGAYDAELVDGGYFAHDLFAVRDETAKIAMGVRNFDGEDAVTSLVSFASLSPLGYEVAPDGRMRFYTDMWQGGYTGSIGLGSELLVFSRSAAPNEDEQVPEGYAALRLSVRKQENMSDANFRGDYAYHALLQPRNDTWRNVVGGAVADATHTLTLIRPAGVLQYRYTVERNGRVSFMGQGSQYATLFDGGDLLIQSLRIGYREDELIPAGYKGLALYVRKDPARKISRADFTGTYRVHELRPGENGVDATSVGAVTAGGNAVYFGTLGGQDFTGRLVLEETGVFRLASNDDVVGTLGAGGDVLVLTSEDRVLGEGAHAPFLQIWVRTAGGRPIPGDADGDGVRDSAETQLGTGRDNPDTDGDGLLDNVDEHPLTPDNTFSATLSQDLFTLAEGDSAPDPVTLTLNSGDFPFFDWELETNAAWAALSKTAGTGDDQIRIDLDTAGFTADDSPYTARFDIAAPYMQPVSTPEIVVEVVNPALDLDLSPDSLTFVAVADQTVPVPAQNVQVSSPDAETFSWSARTNESWLAVSPSNGQGASEVSVSVDVAGLSAGNSPYNGRVLFTPEGAASPTATLGVTLEVLPGRNLDTAFAVGPTMRDQARPAVAASDTHSIVAWEEGNLVVAAVLGPQAVPVLERSVLSLAVLGPASRPAVATSPAGDAWAVWAQEDTAHGVSSIQGRAFDLETGARSNIFGVAGESGSVRGPSVAYAGASDRFAVAYASDVGDTSRVYLTAFNRSPRERAFTTAISGAGEAIGPPALACGPAHDTALVAWTFAESTEDNGTRYGIAARRVAIDTGEPAGAVITLETDDMAELYGVACNPVGDTWHLLWKDPADTLHLATFPAGADNPAIMRQTIAPEADGVGAGFTVAVEPQQLNFLYGISLDGNGALRQQRYTAFGRALGDAAPLPDPGVDTARPDVDCLDGAVELLAVWEDDRLGRTQIHAMRLDAGSADEDGDGLPNDWELANGLDPLDPTGDNGADGDPDNDGLTNLEEFRMDTDPQAADSDGDGLWDRQEDSNRDGVLDPGETDPNAADTDGDGFDDAAEWFLGSNGNDAEDTPNAGMVRLDYGDFAAGEPGAVAVQVAVAETGDYTLSLNGAPGAWNTPADWQATLDGPQTRTLSQGSHLIELTVTPPAEATVDNQGGAFALRFTGPGDLDEQLTAVLVLETRATGTPLPDVDIDALAQRYAPLLRLHRDARLRPVDASVSIARSTLQLGNTRALPVQPDTLALHQAPQAEARLDREGESVPELLEEYPDEPLEAVTYYTVAPLAGPSAEEDVPQGYTVIQYYLHFYADLWGDGINGGHRHEGDWEMVQLLIDAEGNPKQIATTQQHRLVEGNGWAGGTATSWEKVLRNGGTHPVLYVGQGGHSLYVQAGATRYEQGLEVHDGLGTWLAPAGVDTGGYRNTALLRLERIGRIGEADAPLWLRYAGRWGQDAFPQDANDQPAAGVADGGVGPLFLGTPDVPSLWTDPYAWSVRAAAYAPTPETTVTGTLPAELAEMNVILADAQGRFFRTQAAADGAFTIAAPAAVYTLVVAEPGEFGRETFRASARFADTLLCPTPPEATLEVGALTLNGEALTAANNPYALTDADGDGVPDAEDPDIDGDGVLNEDDPDALGDGFDDAYQAADVDGDGVPDYWDDDTDGDGIPDAEDEDANGNGTPDVDEAPDGDGDGFPDPVDLDRDNDGFSNVAELEAGTDPDHFFDTPEARLGDLDLDGDIDAVDLQRIINIALGKAPMNPRGDYDQDGVIDAQDIQRTVLRILEADSIE